jgi:deoxyribodipyrimidine photolyase
VCWHYLLICCAGYPWIDAAMRQLREWGWMHHLARHSVACFLTRGDLYISWEEGQAVFEELLIDAVSGVGGVAVQFGARQI